MLTLSLSILYHTVLHVRINPEPHETALHLLNLDFLQPQREDLVHF